MRLFTARAVLVALVILAAAMVVAMVVLGHGREGFSFVNLRDVAEFKPVGNGAARATPKKRDDGSGSRQRTPRPKHPPNVRPPRSR